MLSNMILSQCHVSNPGYKSKVESSSQIWPRQNLWTVFEVGLPVRNLLAVQWLSTVSSKKEGVVVFVPPDAEWLYHIFTVAGRLSY